jgi:hypothetical protein
MKMILILGALALFPALIYAAKSAADHVASARGSGWGAVSNSAGTHAGTRTYKAEEAFPLAFTIVKKGTDPAAQVAICDATDEPVGWTDSDSGDNAAIGDYVSVALLGCAGKTGKAVAAEAITAGARLYTAADGKVQDTAAAEAWLVGRALTAVASGAVVEFDPCFPVQNPEA